MEELETRTLTFGKSATVEEIKISLQGTPQLTSLEFVETESIDDHAFVRLVGSVNPELERLKCDRLANLKDEDLVIISERCRDLKEVALNSRQGVSSESIASLVSNCASLQSLFLSKEEDDEPCSWSLTENDFRTVCDRSRVAALRSLHLVNFRQVNATALAMISRTFSSLTSADISHCSAVGDGGVCHLISNCVHLESLTLTETGISDLTLHHIASTLSQLTSLDVSRCPQVSDVGITVLAESPVINLRTLKSSSCPLITERSLSEILARSCRSIEEIALRDTNVTRVPNTILRSSRLRSLDLENCRNLEYPPEDVVTRGVQGIMEFFQEHNLTFRLRVVLLGPASGGKTSLVHHLTTDAKTPCEKTNETDAVKVHHWSPFREQKNESILTRAVESEERTLSLDIYDVPGRPVCVRCIQPFLSATSLPVVVFDISDDKSCDSVIGDVSYIQNKLPNTPIILVGMHADRILSETSRKETCAEVERGIREQNQNLRQDLEDELRGLRKITADQRAKCIIVKNRIHWLQQRLQELNTRPNPLVIPASAVTTKGFDEVKTAIIEAALDSFPHMRRPVKEQTRKAFHELSKLKKEIVVMESREIEKLLSLTGETGNGNAAKIAEELKFLCDVGVVQTVSGLSKSSSPLICLDPPSLLQAIFAIHVDNPNKSFRFEAKRFWPKHGAIGKPSPGLLVKALEEIALRGSIRESVFPLMWQGFQFHPDAGVVTKMLQYCLRNFKSREKQCSRICSSAKRGIKVLDINVHEKQVKKIIDFLVQSCFLVHDTNVPLSPTFSNLVSPKFPGLSPHKIYHIPLLNLMSENGPTLNWTPEPFKGDIQLGWRYRFLPRSPPGLVPTVLSFCRLHLPDDCCKLHWRGGLLLKLGQVFIKLSEVTEEDWCLDVTSRITTDEEGDRRATEVLWSTTANVLMLVHRFLATQSGVAYRISVIPCPIYFEVESEDYDDWPEVPIHQCLLGNSDGDQKLSVGIGRFQFKVYLNLLSPIPAHPEEDLFAWFARLSSANITLSGDSFTPALLTEHVEDISDSPPEPSPMRGSLSPHSLASFNSHDNSASPGSDQSIGKERKMARKKSSLKWDIADDRRFTEEEEEKERNRVASGFVAVVIAEAIAKHVCDQTEHMNGQPARSYQKMDLCQAVARASAKAAKAAQSGDAAGTAMAIMEAVQAVDGAPPKRTTPSRANSAMKSKLCVVL